MDRIPLASRLAQQLRLPAVAVGWLSAGLVPADLIGVTPREATVCAAVGVGAAAVALFACAVFDPRLQNAVSALNADRRRLARGLGWRARLFGWGLPGGDGSLIVLRLVLMAELLTACAMVGPGAAAFLAIAAFGLMTVISIALMARSFPTVGFRGLFS